MWINKFGKEKNKGRPNRSLQDYDWKGTIAAHQFFEVSLESRTRGHGYKLYKNRNGIRKNRFFSERVVNPWNDLDERTVTVDTVDKFKRQLSEFGYLDMEVVLTQTV